MMNRNLFAYTTPTGTYPGYVSINRKENGDISIAVRSEGQQTASEMVLTQEQFSLFIIDMVESGYANGVY